MMSSSGHSRNILYLPTLVVAGLLLVAAPAAASETQLWKRTYHYAIAETSVQSAYWRNASQEMRRACDNDADIRRTLGHVRLPGKLALSIKFIVQHWPTAYRIAGFDTTCTMRDK